MAVSSIAQLVESMHVTRMTGVRIPVMWLAIFIYLFFIFLQSFVNCPFCYGCESWTLSKALEAKIEALEMYCFRRIGNVKWRDKVTNDCVLQKLKTKRTLLSDIQKRKLRYYGHVKRSNNILTTAVEGKLEGKRPRGRPRNNWMTDVREWTSLPASACTSRAADQNLWSVIARRPLQRR